MEKKGTQCQRQAGAHSSACHSPTLPSQLCPTTVSWSAVSAEVRAAAPQPGPPETPPCRSLAGMAQTWLTQSPEPSGCCPCSPCPCCRQGALPGTRLCLHVGLSGQSHPDHPQLRQIRRCISAVYKLLLLLKLRFSWEIAALIPPAPQPDSPIYDGCLQNCIFLPSSLSSLVLLGMYFLFLERQKRVRNWRCVCTC